MKTFVNALKEILDGHAPLRCKVIRENQAPLTGIGQKITGKPTNFSEINVLSCIKKQLSLIFHEKQKALP